MTFSLGEVLLLLLTIAAIVLVVMVARAIPRFSAAADDIAATSRRLGALEPQIRTVLENLEAELEELQRVTEASRHVATNVSDVSDESRRVVLDLIHDLEELEVPARYRAAVSGARAGLQVLKAANRRR